MTVQIRNATEEEIPAIARLAGDVFHPTTDWITRQLFPLHLQPKDIPDGDAHQPWRRLRKTACFNAPNCAVIVAIDTTLNNQIVGFAVWDLPVENVDPAVSPAWPALPPDVTDLKAFAELQSILKEDVKAAFGDRGLKDVWCLSPHPIYIYTYHSIYTGHEISNSTNRQQASTYLGLTHSTSGEVLARRF
jgi:hypothetical protein